MPSNRISRWSLPTELTHVLDKDGNHLPTAIRANITQEQLEVYVLHFRTLEITGMLQLPDASFMEQAKAKRSRRAASPDPEYDAAGRRTNTRLQRRRHALEAERHACIESIVTIMPAYCMPKDYRRPTRFIDRVFIPSTDFPSINFIGQILGPRGHSLKELQERCGASIVLRGRGSVKQGRDDFRRASAKDFKDNNDQPLHAVISADSKYKVQEARRLVQQVIDNAISSPEEQNDRKRKQLRELAIMNGTFRDDESRQLIDASIRGGTAICDTQMTTDTRIGQQAGPADNRFEEEYRMLMEDIQRA
ncbi:Arylamine N-acetyltransferase 2 [Paramyrothecium foliicola]|nr:Arylamine N-acetyltransferase 2 [Paramyrothecium foliicola]